MAKLIPSLNGVLVLNEAQGYTAKILQKKLEPDFLSNSRRAHQLIPEHTQKILGMAEMSDYACLMSEFLEESRMHKFDNWSVMLEKITPVIAKLYRRGGVAKTLKAKDYIKSTLAVVSANLTSQRFLQKEFKKTALLFKKCLGKYPPGGSNLYKLFCHGDLTPNNVVHDGKGNIIILDWANGGLHSAFYDLMVQDVYAPNARVWRDFGEIDFVTNRDHDIFHGWSASFCQIIKRITKKTVTNEMMRASLLIALAEMGRKNFLRHQTVQERNEGSKVLTMINTILQNIAD